MFSFFGIIFSGN